MSVLGCQPIPESSLEQRTDCSRKWRFRQLEFSATSQVRRSAAAVGWRNYFTVASLASAPEVSLRHVHNFVAVAVDHGLDHVQVEPRCLREADGGRKGEFLTSDCYVDKCRAGVCKRLVERRLDLLRGVDSPAPNPGIELAHCVRHWRQIT